MSDLALLQYFVAKHVLLCFLLFYVTNAVINVLPKPVSNSNRFYQVAYALLKTFAADFKSHAAIIKALIGPVSISSEEAGIGIDKGKAEAGKGE